MRGAFNKQALEESFELLAAAAADPLPATACLLQQRIKRRGFSNLHRPVKMSVIRLHHPSSSFLFFLSLFVCSKSLGGGIG